MTAAHHLTLIELDSDQPYFHLPESLLAKLRAAYPDHTFLRVNESTRASAPWTDATVYFGWRLSDADVQAAPNLRWVMFAADSVTRRIPATLAERGIPVTNSRGVRAPAMAEHIMAMLLALRRRLPDIARWQPQHAWNKREIIRPEALPQEIAGGTMCIVGYGEIGRRVAAIGKNGFNLRVHGVRARPWLPTPFADAVYPATQAGLLAAVETAQTLVLCLPQTPATDKLIDETILTALPPGAIILNVGRGNSLDLDALQAHLATGHLAGAGLDVFPEEPLPADHPLWDTPRVLISPHVSGITPHLWPRMLALFRRNFARLLAGDPLQNRVDPAVGY